MAALKDLVEIYRCFVGVTVEMEAMVADDVTKGKHVKHEEEEGRH